MRMDMSGRENRDEEVGVMTGLPTVGQAIRAMCMRCLCASSARRVYDCLSGICPLYPANPFRGVERPRIVTPDPDRAEMIHRTRPARKPSKPMVAAQCRQCLAEGETDCPVTACPLWVWRPFQPGGQPKRELSEGNREARRQCMLEVRRSCRNRAVQGEE